jgi:hypothetical protein
MLERDDIGQELWVWFVGHPRKYKEWSALEQKDRDKLIAKSLRNAALKFCEREKAKKVGYDMSELYYYDVSVVEVFLPSIISESYEMPSKIKDLGKKLEEKKQALNIQQTIQDKVGEITKGLKAQVVSVLKKTEVKSEE